MQTSTYTARIIAPAEGMYLTQADPDIEIINRIVTNREIWLAANDDPANYIEITQAEAEAYLAEQAAAEPEPPEEPSNPEES